MAKCRVCGSSYFEEDFVAEVCYILDEDLDLFTSMDILEGMCPECAAKEIRSLIGQGNAYLKKYGL